MFHSMRLSVSYGHNRPGQMASPPTNPLRHTHIYMRRHKPQAQPRCLVVVVVACSSTSLILSLRAAGESYICAAFACDVSTEIEVKEPVFEPTIQHSDIPG